MFKNTASQKIAVFAFDTTTSAPKTGDAANISVYVSKDFGAVTQLTDTSATEMDATNAKGWYLFDVSQTESNADALLFTGKSTTANISIVGQLIYTLPANFTATSIDSNGRVDLIKIAGTTQTARDIGASVLLSAGSGAGQLDFTSGVVKSNVTQWNGTNVSAPATAGIPEVNVKNVNNVSAASVTTINANQGTTQPVNFTGTGTTALAKVDMVDIAGSAVNTASAQIGANVVNAAGTAWNSGAIGASTLATDTITAAKIAADAIGASELAADAVTEIQSGLSTLTQANVRTAVGLASANLDTQLSGIQADTDDIQTRIPAALTANGNIKADTLRIGGTVQTGTDLGAINVTNLNTLSGHDPGETIMGATDLGTGSGFTALASAANLATVDTNVSAVKAKTDSLTFTVASQVDANIQYVNDTQVKGNGSTTAWGPV